ncbi:MAG TPA: TrbI/VirB10 family protein [Thermoanaerobaculia bacterium]|nr:TrbI/VirB10 family protein [Thermoanaerobaculia bacterium]
MSDDPLAPPPLPPVQRLNRGVLLAAAGIVVVTLLAVAFLVSPRPAPRPLPAVRPPLASGDPAFLQRAPGVLPPPRPNPSEQEYLRELLEHPPRPAAPLPPAPVAPSATGDYPPPLGGATAAGGGGSPAPATPPPPPRDLRREAFERALRAPLAEPLANPAAAHGAGSSPFALPPLPGATASFLPPPAPGEAAAADRALRDALAAYPAAWDGAANPSSAPLAPSSSSSSPPLTSSSSLSSLSPSSLPVSGSPATTSPAGSAPSPVTTASLAASFPARYHPPASFATLPAGTLIPALLLTAVNSDLPGPLLAQVSRDVYEPRRLTVLIPRGSRLLGRYEHQVAVGQRRLLVAWTLLQLPDGSAYDLPGLPGADPAGAAGLSARVENHLLRVFGDALLLSLLAAGAELSQPPPRNLNLAPAAGSVASAAVGQELASVGLQLLRRDLAIQPTLRLPPGTPFTVFVNGDLQLAGPAAATGGVSSGELRP